MHTASATAVAAMTERDREAMMTQVAAYLSVPGNTLKKLGVENTELIDAGRVLRFEEGGGMGAGKLKRDGGGSVEWVTLKVDGVDVRPGNPFSVQLCNGTVNIPKGAWGETEWGKDMLALSKSVKAGDSDKILRRVIWNGDIGSFKVSQQRKLSDEERVRLSAFLKRFVFSRVA